MAGGGKGAVYMALIGNGVLTALKVVAFMVTGSGAMLSEAVHSGADTANQGLLYFGMRRSLRPPDSRFHYGYGADRYVFALMSAMGIFILGCGVTVYHGIHSLLHPPTLTTSWITYAVLSAAVVIDGYVFILAVREVNSGRGDKGFLSFIRSSTDPTLIAVLFEDFVATAGALIAMAGIGLANITGNPVYDSITSIIIGALLGVMAIWLGWRNRQLILGPAIPKETQDAVMAFLRDHKSVEEVHTLRTRVVAAGSFRIAADIDFDGGYLGRQHVEWLQEQASSADGDEDWARIAAEFGDKIVNDLAVEVDDVERQIVEKFPEIHHIDMEAD
ncbi:MAG: cation diffusion facilitator family transporter [Myxococcales bacterium]|nr:cation diffusion facilitator family transporter [Myxococcales bacterium]